MEEGLAVKMVEKFKVNYKYRGEVLVFEISFNKAYELFRNWKDSEITLKKLCKLNRLHYPAMTKIFYSNKDREELVKKYENEIRRRVK